MSAPSPATEPANRATQPLAAAPADRLLVWLTGLIDACDQAIIFIDPGWRITYWSRRAEQMLGWNAEIVLGKGLGSALGMTPEGSRLLRQSFDEKSPLLRQRLSLRRAGGTAVDVQLTLTQFAEEPDGITPGALVILQDDVASRVNQEFQKFFYAVDQSMVGALIATPAGIVEYANPRAVSLLGWSPLQLVGSRLLGEPTHADSIGLLPTECLSVTEWRGDRLFNHPDQTQLSLYVVASGIRDASGRLVNRVVLFEDVSERRALELAERELRDRLAHAGRLAALGEMATTIAHEINQPLAAIANFSQGSLRRLESGQFQVEPIIGALQEISRQVTRTSDIIQNVRRLSRHHQAVMRPIDLGALVRQLMPMLKMSARPHDVTIDFYSSLDAPLVLGDETQMTQVVLNLARNGIEAMADTPPAKRQLDITIHRADDSELPSLRLEVSDRGSGVTDENLEVLGTPFFSTRPNGLGLGLSITRTLLESHGTHLDVARNDPAFGGMRFSFVLPLHPAD